MTTLLEKIEKLIKREKTTPDRKVIKDEAPKSSSEILTELFSAFNAEPPKLDDMVNKKSKKSKRKHKKEKKKRSRSSSSTKSDDTDYTRKRKKKKKTKLRKRKDRSPLSQERTPPRAKVVCTATNIKKEPVTIKSESKNKEDNIEIKKDPNEETCIELGEIDTATIPMPTSTNVLVPLPDSKSNVDKKSDTTDSDKQKGKIQIKNLKFSAVFEETVKKAEEEARKKAEKVEDGECTDSTSDSSDDEEPENSQFPKSSDPGGILKKQAAEEEIKILDEVKTSKTKASEVSKSSTRERSRSRRRSRSRSKDRSSKYRHRSRSRRRSRSRYRSFSRSKRRTRSRSRRRSSSKPKYRSRHHSPRHRSWRSRSPSGVKLADSEKKRLLEVARRNAINMLKNGAVPAGAAALPLHTRNQVMAAIQSGGKSVDELTDFCKHLSKKEALGELSSVSSNDEAMSENEDTIAFHHPFLVKEKAPIVMNIRGGVPLPVKSNTLQVANKEELRIQFPVSSGSQHRDTAIEWVPVSPKKDNMQIEKLNAKHSKAVVAAAVVVPKLSPSPEMTPPQTAPYVTTYALGNNSTPLLALPAPGPQAYPPGIEPPKDDLAAVISQKLSMIRREQEQTELNSTAGFGWNSGALMPGTSEPFPLLGLGLGFGADQLGQFTGSTGVQMLTPRELAGGAHAWAKKDQLVRAAPVEGGMGMHLLQKMGWCPGQGLGKEGTGTLQPLLLEVKLDTKGLHAKEEGSNRQAKQGIKPPRMGRRGPAPLIAGGKHPVSLLGEYCSKQKLGPPEYNLCLECGPDHKKTFLFRVKVAGVEYQPAIASANKKQAKADAAQLALQKLGIVT